MELLYVSGPAQSDVRWDSEMQLGRRRLYTFIDRWRTINSRTVLMAATGWWEEEAGVSITDDGMGMMYLQIKRAVDNSFRQDNKACWQGFRNLQGTSASTIKVKR